MKNTRLITFSALLGVFSSVGIAADTTLAGWTFSQFVSEGVPNVDINSFDPVGSIVATYRGDFVPDSNVVDGTITSLNGNVYNDPSFGTWDFSGFDTSNANDVRADTFSALNTTNTTTLDGKFMHLTDAAGMMLTFRAQNTLWDITVPGTGAYENASVADFTYAARGNGGAATVEWLVGGTVFSTQVIAAASFNVYSAELPVEFYGNGVIQGRLVSGQVSFDNVQVNGALAAIPEASSFAAVAGLAGLAFAGLRRRRA